MEWLFQSNFSSMEWILYVTVLLQGENWMHFGLKRLVLDRQVQAHAGFVNM